MEMEPGRAERVRELDEERGKAADAAAWAAAGLEVAPEEAAYALVAEKLYPTREGFRATQRNVRSAARG